MQQVKNSVVKFAASLGLVTGVCGLALTGCGKTDGTSTGKPGSVGIVDLDQVSTDVGWTGEIKADSDAALSEIKSQLQVYQTGLKKAWEDRRKAIGEAAKLNADDLKVINSDSINGDDFQKIHWSKDQKDEFVHSASEAQQKLNEAGQYAQQQMQQRQARVIESYREAMKPSVRRVAVDKSVTTVLSTSPTNPGNVFYYDSAVDISNAVVDDLRKAMPQHVPIPMPKLNLPEFHFTSNVPAAVTAPAVTPAPAHTPDASH